MNPPLKDCMAFMPAAASVKKGVTLVIHGLNVKPEAMHALVYFLNSCGSDVYLLKLCGHGRGDVKTVTADVWKEEVLAGYEAAKQASLQGGVPLFFLGYSLGALLGQSLIALSQQVQPFSKQILFSPAIGLRRTSYLVRHLFFLGGRFQLPSFSPRAYKANRGLPLALYQILYAEEKKVLAAPASQLNMPTLVFMDPKDELISYKRLQTLLQKGHFINWQLIPLSTSFAGRKEKFHHLILDENTMGAANWKVVTGKMQAFLFGF